MRANGGLEAQNQKLTNIYCWTFSNGETISCEFKEGIAISVLFVKKESWTGEELGNMTLNITNTRSRNWDIAIPIHKKSGDLFVVNVMFSRDGKFVTRFSIDMTTNYRQLLNTWFFIPKLYTYPNQREKRSRPFFRKSTET